ncbi:MAG: ABC transporter ATP-binding protein [Alphaproteobacteria bacterium]|nr:ABC transporter ATP-binding protein [Alphaproteobacteria bacterium]
MNKPALALAGVTKIFQQGENRLEILKGCNLSIHPGELVALVGPSGAGKSTLLHIAGLLEHPTDGSITIGGVEASRANDAERTRLRRQFIGYVYQMHHLLPEFSAAENLIVPQMIAGIGQSVAAKRAEALLSMVGLGKRGSHRPAQLSGGEQQRVAIARALANQPQLLIADEPTGNLDPTTSAQVFSMLQELVRGQNLALLMATHNMELAGRMDRVIRLQDGFVA